VDLRSAFFGVFVAGGLGIAAACGGSAASHVGAGDDASVGDDAGLGDDGGVTPGMDAAPGKDAAPQPHGDAGPPPPMTSAVTIIVEPSDRAAALVAAIQGARTSVHMTMYLLSSNTVMNALVARKNAGVDVKVLLNQSFPPNGGTNAQSFQQLSNAGVNVKWAPGAFTFTHEKTVIIDGTTAWIMTMNATITSPTDNREYLAVDTDPADVAEAEAIFAGDWGNMATSAKRLVAATDNAYSKIVQFIASASTSIDMEAEELGDPGVTAALANAADRGVVVRIVVANGTPSTSQSTAIATLKQHGVKLVTVSTPYIHAKSIVVDGKSAFVGSENFSTGSLKYNRELGVLFNAPAEVQKVLSTTSLDFGRGTPL